MIMAKNLARVALVGLAAVLSPPLPAAGDLTHQKPLTVTVRLGDAKNHLRYYPSTLTFETGKLYRLIISNPSPTKHYFSSGRMAAAVFTRKVQIAHPNGDVMAEVKGSVREIEVYPGYSAEWWFVPVKAGTVEDLRCTIPGHGEAGMIGRIVIR